MSQQMRVRTDGADKYWMVIEHDLPTQPGGYMKAVVLAWDVPDDDTETRQAAQGLADSLSVDVMHEVPPGRTTGDAFSGTSPRQIRPEEQRGFSQGSEEGNRDR
jgi:hypothetical protein